MLVSAAVSAAPPPGFLPVVSNEAASADPQAVLTFDAKQPIGSRSDLELLFRVSEKPPSQFRIGAEGEKFGLDATSGEPLRYDGPRGVQRILNYLVERGKWVEERETPNAPLIAVRDGLASVTLEPGAQFELSGAPFASLHDVNQELTEHLAEIAPISAEMHVVWLGLGFHPFAQQAQLDWVPKARYAIMREYLMTRGSGGLDMMRRTCTVQANFDYSSERDALRKLAVGLKLGPLTTAMFANSPYAEGQSPGVLSYRAKTWLDVDPDRTGLLPATWTAHAGYGAYIDWALACPMFMFKRDGHAIDNRGQSFADFLEKGFQGHHARLGDWEMHLNTLFPEVRLKRTLEIRGADSLPGRLYPALSAFWTGIFYDETALSEAETLTADFRHDELMALRRDVPFHALRAPFRGGQLAELAQDAIRISKGGLKRRAILDATGRDESRFLDEMATMAAAARCPADDILDATQGLQGNDLRATLLRVAQV